MNLQFIDVLISVFSLVLLIIPGFILVKCKMLKDGATKVFSTFLLFACQPALSFMSFQKSTYSPSIAVNMIIVACMTFIVHFFVIGFVALIFKNRKNDDRVNVIKYASVFGNCGFMGIPFLQTLFSGIEDGAYIGEVLVYAGVVIAVFNLLAWTVGIYLITGDKQYISIKKAIINPATLALLIGLPIFIILKQPIASVDTGIPSINMLLQKVMASVNFLSEMVTPIAMTVLGMRLATLKLKELFTFKGMYVSAFMKQIVSPVIAIGVSALVSIFVSDSFLVMSCVVFFTMAMPTATNTILFSEQYGKDAVSASKAMLFSTITSVFTIPLVFLLFKAVFGI